MEDSLMNRVLMKRPAILSACAAMGLSVGALAADVTIADLAPSDSIVVISIDNYEQMRASFDRTGFKAIWTDPGMQKWFHRQAAEFFADFEETLDGMGLEKEDLKSPHGMAGGAMWMVLNDENVLEPRLLIAADYGDEAESMDGVMMQMMDEGQDRDQITVDEDEYAGVTIYKITQLEAGEDDADEDGEEEWEWEEPSGPLSFENQDMYYARSGDMLFVCSDARALENTIDRVKSGKEMHTVRENASYAKSLSQVGQHDMSASFLVSPLLDMMKKAKEAGGDDEMGMMMFDPMMVMGMLGVDQVKAVTFGVDFDADAGMLEQTWSVICPEKKGLVALFDNPPTNNTPPSWVTGNATSYTSFQFRFADLIPTIREIANGMPEEEGQQMLQGVEMAAGFVGPLLAQMDPQVILAQGYERPFSPESQTMLVSMKAKDQAALSDAVTNLVNTGMVPLQSRDFLGNTIWEMDPSMAGMGPEISIGIGGGHIFFGKTGEIENALRNAGADNASLADEEAFQHAAKSVGTDAMGFTYTDMRTTIEYLDWTMRNYEAIVRAQFSGPEWQEDEDMKEFAEEMIASQLEEMPGWMQDAPPLDVVIRNIGDMAGQMRSTPDGFVMKSVVLRPRK